MLLFYYVALSLCGAVHLHTAVFIVTTNMQLLEQLAGRKTTLNHRQKLSKDSLTHNLKHTNVTFSK